MYDIIIIGAGPAGMTASIYSRRALKKTLVLEASNYGGQIINTLDIENYIFMFNYFIMSSAVNFTSSHGRPAFSFPKCP